MQGCLCRICYWYHLHRRQVPLVRLADFCAGGHKFKAIVRPDWIDLRLVPLDRPRIGLYPLYVFNFFILILNFWKESKGLSGSIQKCLQSRSFFGRRLVKNPFFPFAGTLLFDEEILQSVVRPVIHTRLGDTKQPSKHKMCSSTIFWRPVQIAHTTRLPKK